MKTMNFLFASLICISPLRQILAFNLSKPPWLFNFVLSVSLVGIISSARSGFSVSENVSLSKRPLTSALMASPHLSFVCAESLGIWVSASKFLSLFGCKIGVIVTRSSGNSSLFPVGKFQ